MASLPSVMSEEINEAGGESSDPNPCPICLSLLTRAAYLDRCFHRYCYQCIVRWTEVVSIRSSSSHQPTSVKCPLCKTENFSIVYDYDGNTFQRHFINQNIGNCAFFTKAHKYRLQCYYTEPGLLSKTFDVGRYWKTRKYLHRNNWLERWLTRELQALIQEQDVEIIMHHIHGVIESFSQRRDPKGSTYIPRQSQDEFKAAVANAARPFLLARTERFVDELELFLASGMMIEAYDNAYKKCLGWKQHEESSKDETTAREDGTETPYLHFFDDDSEEADWEEGMLV